MLRIFFLAAAATLAAHADILPERIPGFARGPESAPKIADRAIWDEFGLSGAAEADYTGAEGKFHVTVWRLQDSTSAMAAFRWQRPAGATVSKWEKLAVETPKSLLFAFGNYLFQYDGRRPQVTEFEQLAARLPKLEKASLPTLPGFLPGRNRVGGSDRYILGPASLNAFAGQIPPGVAGFSAGAEAVDARYASPAGELHLVMFSYPTPHIARERVPEFQKISGAVVKRSGPLVAVVLPPANADEAERLLAEVRYEANITLNQKVPGKDENAGSLIVAVFTLAGILILFALAGGLMFGGFRLFLRKLSGRTGDEGEMIVLHIQDK